MGAAETTLLLGADCETPGVLEARPVADGGSACVLSAGAREGTSRTKLDPNEDAVLVIDDGDACLLAVADAHFGRSSSHRLMERIAAEVSPRVRNLYALSEAIEELRDDARDPDDPSETTLVVAVLVRSARRGFGVSFGDSSGIYLSLDQVPRVLTKKTPGFVTLGRPESLARTEALTFRFVTTPGDLILVYTDGVDECHYRKPQTSVGPRHLMQVLAEAGNDPLRFANRLAEVALAGVDGNPGGEDNLAIAVARA